MADQTDQAVRMRAALRAAAVVRRVFSGRRENQVEVHLGRDDLAALLVVAYEQGWKDRQGVGE